MEPQTPPANQTSNQEPEPQATVAPQRSQIQSVKQSVLKKIPKNNGKIKAIYAGIAIIVVLAGVGTGWLLAGRPSKGEVGGSATGVAPGAETGVNEAGLADEETFRDSAEGILEEGGINGEGTHHLVRGGGESQYVYLTSTVIDLQGFVGKNVTVWGETIAAQKAGWLMDVGRIKVAE